MQQTTKGVIDI